MPFLPRGSRGQSPQKNKLPCRDHGFNLGEGECSRPLPQVEAIVGYGFVFSGVGKVRNFALSSPCLPEADLAGRGITQEGIR
jgi:hypothetical protein